MLGYKQMNRSSSFIGKNIYYTTVNIVVLRFIGCRRCARGMPKTSVGIIVHK